MFQKWCPVLLLVRIPRRAEPDTSEFWFLACQDPEHRKPEVLMVQRNENAKIFSEYMGTSPSFSSCQHIRMQPCCPPGDVDTKFSDAPPHGPQPLVLLACTGEAWPPRCPRHGG